jgi:hypothetical protein
MTKPTKKRIEEVAKKLLVNWLPGAQETAAGAWSRTHNWDKHNWRQLAKYVLTELCPADDYKMPPYMGEAAYRSALARKLAAKRRNRWLDVAGPKSCKLVRGKAVCK